MKKNIKLLFYIISSAFKMSRIPYFLLIILKIISLILSVYLYVYIGNIINIIVSDLNQISEIKYFIIPLIKLGLLTLATDVFYGVINSLEDIIYNITNVKIGKKIISITKSIPIRDFDDVESCDEYTRVCDGFRAIPSTFSALISFILLFCRFSASFIILWNINFIFSVILTFAFLIGILLNLNSSKKMTDIWELLSNKSRKISYLESLFVNKNSNKEIRLLNLKDEYLNKLFNLKNEVSSFEINGQKSVNKKLPFILLLHISFLQLLM